MGLSYCGAVSGWYCMSFIESLDKTSVYIQGAYFSASHFNGETDPSRGAEGTRDR